MSSGTAVGAVYVQTNESSNRVVVFERGDDGALSQGSAYATGGAGSGVPHLTSQGSVVLSSDGGFLLVTNAGSDDVSVFGVDAADGLVLVGQSPTGPAPKSVAEHGGLVYVLATGGPTVAGFRLGEHGLEAIAGAERALSPDADPTQVGFTPDGSTLIVPERGTDSISAMAVGADGTLGMMQTVASSGPTPDGFAITAGGTLVVTEAFRFGWAVGGDGSLSPVGSWGGLPSTVAGVAAS